MDFHKAVKVAVALRGTSMTMIAIDMGVNRKTLYSAIKGNPTLSTILSISRSLGMKASELLELGQEEV